MENHRATVRSRCPPFEAHGVRDVDPRQAEGATKAHEASISDGPTVPWTEMEGSMMSSI